MPESGQPAPPAAAQPAAQRLCAVYRSSRVAEMYLYVDLRDELRRVPEPLLERFGTPQLALKLALYPGRRLARADADRILAALDEPGYYLQMPPPPDADGPDARRG